ncbi:MAG: dockerin type I repeat-containing protein [Lachnospiraceae bacterium]
MMTNTAFATNDASITVKEENFDWLPTIMDEYEKFIAENGTVSVYGKYIIYCDKVNDSTGSDVIMKQTGTAEIKEINKYTIVETVEPYPDGCAENVVYVYEAITSGTVEITISQGRKWDTDAPEEKKDSGKYEISEELIITEIPAFDEESFFVVVGTYGNDYTQLRYFYPKSNGGYSADKVVLNNANEDFSYGDVLIAENVVELTKVYDFQNDPAYAMSYYYSLSEDVTLKNVGNCSELMEQKELSISDKNYDGSGHWSINLVDKTGNKYYYGLNILASTLGIDIVYGSEIGDIYSFAFNNGNIVIPLASVNEEVLLGDVNADSKFNVADVVTLQKWLLGAPDVTLPNWEAADLCKDGELNAFDLCVMKQELINK